ncbi:hypothetical protein NQ315_013433 [Exocentrus adspersus]|uniref:Uncharacterized protein n=1 Tax=Exocentrus adspersus TaxID=1586481 RepID=A0AAV8VI81_9CUCU|nr:hypothetical protein NQ315_013433 [Exocentrus adspersus]
MNENAKLKLKLIEAQTQIDNIDTISQRLHETDSVKNEYEILKQQLNTVMVHLQNNKAPKHDPEIITNLEQSMEELLLSIDKSDLKVLFQDRVTLWKKQLEIIKSMIGADTDQLQTQFKETLQKLQESQNKVKKLEDVLEDLTSAKTIAEGEKCTYQYQLKDCENQLQHTCKTNKKLEAEMDALTNQLQEKEDRMYQLMQNNAKEEIDKLKEALSYKDNILKICEENKKELNELLHKTQLQLEDAKNEVLVLQNKLAEMDDTKVRHSIEQELKETESQVEQSKLEEADGCETEHFKKCVQAEILKCELKLREDLQVEYLRKMRDIEKKYKKACSATNQLYEEQVEKMKNQETRYREYLARILAECAGKIDEFEKEKQTLLSRINSLQTEFANFKKRTHLTEEQYKQSVQQIQIKSEKRVEEWKSWSKQFVSNCLKVELINKKCRDGILTRMKDVDSEVANIEKAYKEKVRKCLKNDKIKIQC